MSYAGMVTQIEKVFDVDARALELMRLDVAADIEGVPVPWFHKRMRIRWKQFAAEIGDVDYTQMGKKEIQTLYLGKKPNLNRIYDKVAERKEQYRKLLRRQGRDQCLPTFVEKYGHSESGLILTRVERQMAAGRVPAMLSTVGDLTKAPDFNPYDRLEILSPGIPQPSVEDFDVTTWLAGMKFRELAEEMGIHQARSWLNKHSPGHASRFLKTYAPFLPPAGSEDAEITVEKLRECYSNSVNRQLR